MSRSIVVATLVVLVCLGLVTAPADATPPGVARDDLAAPGPFAVASTARIVPCAGPSAAEQNADARRQGARTALQCTTTQPVIGGPSNSIDFWYPTTAPGPRPLVVFVPGDGANPGYFAALARHWAGYGFVVAIATIRQEILPGSPSYGVRRALAAGRDPRSPMFGRIDTRSVILAGHSAGATKAIEAAGLDGASRRGVPTPADLTLPRGTRLTAVLALQPDVYTVTAGVDVPTFTVTGDADRTSRPDPIGVLVQDRIDGPAWFAVARGAPHLITVDPVRTVPFAGAATAFLLATTGDASACHTFVGRDWALRDDPTFVRAVRNRAATATACPVGGAR
ncbi:poly(ethylene terephthalate) hydrolase family protein [Williamsia sp. SKLECPSW1]